MSFKQTHHSSSACDRIATLSQFTIKVLPFMALVLCTGSDSVLMKTRQLILESAGHKVLSASSRREVEILCSTFTFHVAVLGQNATPSLKRETLASVRKSCPAAKVLELYPSHTGKCLKMLTPGSKCRLKVHTCSSTWWKGWRQMRVGNRLEYNLE